MREREEEQEMKKRKEKKQSDREGRRARGYNHLRAESRDEEPLQEEGEEEK